MSNRNKLFEVTVFNTSTDKTWRKFLVKAPSSKIAGDIVFNLNERANKVGDVPLIPTQHALKSTEIVFENAVAEVQVRGIYR